MDLEGGLGEWHSIDRRTIISIFEMYCTKFEFLIFHI